MTNTVLAPEITAALVDELTPDIPMKRMRGTDAADRLEAAADTVTEARRKAATARRVRISKEKSKQDAEAEESSGTAFDSLTDEQLQDAWRIVGPLLPVIGKVASQRLRRMSRLGSHIDEDVVGVVHDRMCVRVQTAKTAGGRKFAVEELAEAAHELADRDLPRSRKAARNWLMKAVIRVTKDALYEADVRARGGDVLSLEDEGGIAMDADAYEVWWAGQRPYQDAGAVADAPGRDEFYDRFKADGGITMMGARFPQPGVPDRTKFLLALTEEITRRRLDPMVEIVLANIRSDGTCAWRACAQAVFEADPAAPRGVWDAVVAATRHHANPDDRRRLAARQCARGAFGWVFDMPHA